jgi:Ca2+-binding EF-hand superfamily protein
MSSPQSQPVPALVRGQSLSQYISSASDHELQQARELFNLIDKDGHGRISGVALRRVFRDSGVDASEVRTLLLFCCCVGFC